MDMQDFVDRGVDFAIVLDEVFGPRSDKLSPGLRELLQELWHRGIEFGAYARDEMAELPEAVVVPARFDTSRATKKIEEMKKTREKLVEMAETVALRLENTVDPSPMQRLEGDDLTKAVHNFLTRTARIELKLTELLREAEKFRVFQR